MSIRLQSSAPTALPGYRQAGAPVLCCRRYHEPAAAQACPKGTIMLEKDPRSGLVSNPMFDPATQVFDADYEETQFFSPLFRDYVAQTVRQLPGPESGLVIVEIGCGKGDFLIELCRTSGAKGYGIDPSYRPDRHPGDLVADVTFLTEPLAARHADLVPDLVICRHTLEHIADLPAFLGQLRALGRDGHTRYFLDVPDATRVFEEGAFWDVYYEHCHYFTASSFRHVLDQAGFRVEALNTQFHGQFLCVSAVAGGAGLSGAVPACGPDSAYEGFPGRAARQRARFAGWLSDRADGRVILWGAGSKAVAFVTALGTPPNLVAAIDINPHKAGTFLPGSGLPVFGLDRLPEIAPGHVLLMNPVYRAEVRASLQDAGLDPEITALGDPW